MRTIDKVYIDGKFVTPHGAELAPLYNPATEQLIGQVRLADETDAHAAVAAAKRALTTFSHATRQERLAILRRLSAAFTARLDDLSNAMIEEYGATRTLVEAGMPKAAAVFDEAAEVVESYEFTRSDGGTTVTLAPVGVAAAITPWNYSIVFVAQKVASAIAAGCTIVVKPSELSAIQTQVMTECFDAAEVPPGVINVVTGRGDVVGEVLTTHPDIAKVGFTGSTAVGQQIMRNAAATMKRLTLELGGKSPSILLDDADIPASVATALTAGFMNNGQACFAGTRILAPESRIDEVLEAIKANVAELKVGDPDDPSTAIGPLVNQKQFERVHSYIRLGQEEGAKLLTGGEGRPDDLRTGWYVKPTVFTGVTNQMRIAREEIFGPVLVVIPYSDEQEAIEIANDTPYGLQAYVFSTDTERARRVAGQIEAGTVLINRAFGDPDAPFGGVKQSGIGREHGAYGLEGFLEPRVVTA
ncbi:aldehyde dehydrogenase family protein [Plantactinospora sp. KLBMP9567]|uniref:aldehyde dehydrogenase family protein n=1 Tax=Plantactinospora sp. KLBMP9567 TaxID=3085900 RepID=UPI002981E7EF|nr:aldehyde dehydrogenase family protein [Plantactinospora sp. KLBMP9567]MDW5326729.1 aldehyde dehydrogenase family protein [Plantactinospora sp. KLBMP9567]